MEHRVLVADRRANVATIYVNAVAQSATVNLSTLTGSLASTADRNIGVNSGYFDGSMTEFAISPRRSPRPK